MRRTTDTNAERGSGTNAERQGTYGESSLSQSVQASQAGGEAETNANNNQTRSGLSASGRIINAHISGGPSSSNTASVQGGVEFQPQSEQRQLLPNPIASNPGNNEALLSQLNPLLLMQQALNLNPSLAASLPVQNTSLFPSLLLPQAMGGPLSNVPFNQPTPGVAGAAGASGSLVPSIAAPQLQIDASTLLAALLGQNAAFPQQLQQQRPNQMPATLPSAILAHLSTAVPAAVPSSMAMLQQRVETTAATETKPPPSLTNRPAIPLSLELDEKTLSPYQCELRKHIELFETQMEDITTLQGRNIPIKLGQVGIRCRHCAQHRNAAGRISKGGVYYSKSLEGLYQVAQNLSKVHLCSSCPNIPESTKARLAQMQLVNKRASGGKEYWVYGLDQLGVYEDGKILRFRPEEHRREESKSGN